MMEYYFSTTISDDFDNVIEDVTHALQDVGFGVITEIDVTQTFKEKLDVGFRNYQILGACSPKFAHKAIQLEANVGTMLPCNVIVQEQDDGTVEVSAVNPVASMQAIKNEELMAVAETVKEKMEAVIQAV